MNQGKTLSGSEVEDVWNPHESEENALTLVRNPVVGILKSYL